MTKQAKPQISVILPPEDKKALDAYCDEMDITVSQLIRRLLRAHLGTYKPPVVDELEFGE